jgi:SAM-dependent methyltransferase
MFENLNLGALTFEPCLCDLCGAETFVEYKKVHFLGRTFRFVRCADCGLVYQNPRLTKESRQHIYMTTDYWCSRDANAKGEMLNYYSYIDDDHWRMANADLRIAWLARYVDPGAKILDLGCSDGLFVHVLSEAGYRAVGIDISAAMVASGQERYGGDLRCADFEGVWPFNEKFDAITCFATLSNFANPSRVFANVSKHLKPGGVFMFNYGDCSRLVPRLLGKRFYAFRPTAQTIYSAGTIRSYLNRCGLTVVASWDDVQVTALGRLLGFLRFPSLLRAAERMRLAGWPIRLRLPTGPMVCARRPIDS